MKIPITEFKQDYKKSWEYAVSQIYDYQKEVERLYSIIKEAREYIKDHTTHYTSYLGREHKVVPKIELQREAYDKLLEILDKVGEE